MFGEGFIIRQEHLMRLLWKDAAVAIGVSHVFVYVVDDLLLLQHIYNCDERSEKQAVRS